MRVFEIIKIDGVGGMEDLKNWIKEIDYDEESLYECIEIYMFFRMLEVRNIMFDFGKLNWIFFLI